MTDLSCLLSVFSNTFPERLQEEPDDVWISLRGFPG